MRSIGGTSLGIAGLLFVASAVVFGATFVNALRVQEVPIPSETEGREAYGPGGGAAQPSLPGIVYPAVTSDEILGAVNQDLFQPDRTPPVERYLLPNERVAFVQNSRDNRRQREPNLRIVGTALAGDLALAVVQLNDSIPFALLLGEEVDGYMLAAVSEESVTFTGDGAEFTFPVVEPQRGSSSNGRNRNARGDAATAEAAQALQERVQQMIQGMGRGQMQRGVGVPVAFPTDVPIRIIRPGGGGGGETLP